MPTSTFPFAPGRLHQSITAGELYEGSIAQDFFRDCEWEYAKSSPRDNWLNHFDYIVNKDGRSFKVEIKSPKRCRVPGAQNEDLVLLEYTGITGKPGWLQGRADYIFQFFSETKMLCYHREQALQVGAVRLMHQSKIGLDAKGCHEKGPSIKMLFGGSH
jgi:hypothetical protein